MADPVRQRHHVLQSVRSYFSENGYLEVDTPILVSCPGSEIFLQYFSTQWLDLRAQSHPYYLRSSPELAMKRLLLRGYHKIFQIAKSFRNGGEIGDWHQPEFTMLEWYTGHSDLESCLQQTLDLLKHTVTDANRHQEVPRPILEGILKPVRMTIKQAFLQWTQLDFKALDEDFLDQARSKEFPFLNDQDNAYDAYGKIYFHLIEPELKRQPLVILERFPKALSCLCASDGDWSLRFEVVAYGVELCNAFQELTSAEDNAVTFTDIGKRRRELGLAEIPPDEEFLQDLLTLGPLPPATGNALGLDRLLAILSGYPSIYPTVSFPVPHPI